MTLPITGETALWLAIPFGMIFGVLLHRGGVADYNVIVNQFRFRDFTVLKIMLTAIVVGGLGVWALHGMGQAQYQIKPANLLGVALGAAFFGIGMVLYGYMPRHWGRRHRHWEPPRIGRFWRNARWRRALRAQLSLGRSAYPNCCRYRKGAPA